MNVVRISERMLTVDEVLVEDNMGVIEAVGGITLGWPRERAILEFIEAEEQNLRILAREAVEVLLIELGIKSYRNG